MRILEHHCCIYLTLDTKCVRVEFLLSGNGAIIDDSILVHLRVEHATYPLFNVPRCKSEILKSSIFRNLKLVKIRVVGLHSLLEDSL